MVLQSGRAKKKKPRQAGIADGGALGIMSQAGISVRRLSLETALPAGILALLLVPHPVYMQHPDVELRSDAPIGVFDSGIGGLSVLQALRAQLPQEHFVYLADSRHAPYGEKDASFVQQRTLSIARWLRQQKGIKALVVACNTATAVAIELLRQEWPQLALIGVEPAIKPAAALTRSGRVGVLATRGTVSSRRFARLLEQYGSQAAFVVQACDGLALAIEQSTEEALPAPLSTSKIRALCAEYTGALGQFGQESGQIDTLVLGCTHYVFARGLLRELLGNEVQILDTGAAVARQTQRLLQELDLLRQRAGPGQVHLLTTGQLPALQAAAARWLDLPPERCAAVQVLSVGWL